MFRQRRGDCVRPKVQCVGVRCVAAINAARCRGCGALLDDLRQGLLLLVTRRCRQIPLQAWLLPRWRWHSEFRPIIRSIGFRLFSGVSTCTECPSSSRSAQLQAKFQLIHPFAQACSGTSIAEHVHVFVVRAVVRQFVAGRQFLLRHQPRLQLGRQAFGEVAVRGHPKESALA